MINVNDKILSEVDESEMWLLLHLTKRLGKKMFCWPANKTILKDTGWGIEKLQRVKKSLIDKKIISVEVSDGTSNTYHIETDCLGVFIDVNRLSDTPSEKPVYPPRETQQPSLPENQVSKYYQSEVLISNPTLSLATQVLKIIDELKIKYGNNAKHHPLSESTSREKLVRNRLKDLKKLWPGKDFLKAIQWVFEYKAKQWSSTDNWQYFTPETLLSEKHFIPYCEEARANNGIPLLKNNGKASTQQVVIHRAEGTNNSEQLNNIYKGTSLEIPSKQTA